MYKSIKRYSGKGSANTIYSLSTDVGKRGLVQQIQVIYSASPTQAGITVILDSGLGTDYDATMYTGSANAQENILPLNYNPIILWDDDVLTVTAPAGGIAITATIAILIAEL